tara:strand:- start:546 stop:965 length:420 start_codon:yes stop_codon:yes gene_type:complete
LIVLVDTTIWSLALRRRKSYAKDAVWVAELSELITESRATLIGPIRQELLSGISDPDNFESVRRHLSAFDDLPIETGDYEEAARAFTICRAKGIQGSHIDFLICAVARRYGAPVFTTDKDFTGFARHLDLVLYRPRTMG